MSIDELCALPVAELAAKDSALFMWATFPQLPEALRLIRAWGFTYKSVAFVWLKKNKKADSWFYGLGFWTRANAEISSPILRTPIPARACCSMEKEKRRQLAARKKALYTEYRSAQEEMRQAVAVKANIDHLLGVTDGQRKKEQER